MWRAAVLKERFCLDRLTLRRLCSAQNSSFVKYLLEKKIEQKEAKISEERERERGEEERRQRESSFFLYCKQDKKRTLLFFLKIRLDLAKQLCVVSNYILVLYV